MRKWSYEEATQVIPEVIERAVRMVSEAASEYESQWGSYHIDRGQDRLYGKRHPSTVLSTVRKNEMMLATPLGSEVQPASLAAQFQGRKSSTRFTG